MSVPQPVPPPSTPPSDTGSLLQGFLLGWAALVVGIVANGMLWTLQSFVGPNMAGLNFIFIGIGMLPLFAMIALAIWFNSRGKTRAARGVWLALGSVFALILLLVAACFGLLLTGAFGNMH